MNRVLVTGTAGYIGSVVTEYLVNNNYEVVGIDNFQQGHRDAVHSKIQFYEGDIGDLNFLNLIFSKHKIDYVFHFAAETTIDFCFTHPDKYFQNNIVNGLNLLNIMNENKCFKIVFSSTAAIFGNPEYSPIDEQHPTVPINSYGESKLIFENILKWYSKAYGFRYNLFRYFNAAGATKFNGEDRMHETHLLPIVLKNILGRIQQMKVFGKDYPTQDGTCVRDYVHVEDIAQAHILAIENIKRNPEGKYNLGSGTGFSVLEVIEAAEKVTGKKASWNFAERRKGDPAILVASNDLAKQELEWNPLKSSIEKIVEDA